MEQQKVEQIENKPTESNLILFLSFLKIRSLSNLYCIGYTIIGSIFLLLGVIMLITSASLIGRYFFDIDILVRLIPAFDNVSSLLLWIALIISTIIVCNESKFAPDLEPISEEYELLSSMIFHDLAVGLRVQKTKHKWGRGDVEVVKSPLIIRVLAVIGITIFTIIHLALKLIAAMAGLVFFVTVGIMTIAFIIASLYKSTDWTVITYALLLAPPFALFGNVFIMTMYLETEYWIKLCKFLLYKNVFNTY